MKTVDTLSKKTIYDFDVGFSGKLIFSPLSVQSPIVSIENPGYGPVYHPGPAPSGKLCLVTFSKDSLIR